MERYLFNSQMKKLLTLFTLLFTIMLPSTSSAEWTKVTKNSAGDTYYIDFDKILTLDGYVYYWSLIDYQKPQPHLSATSKHQMDCSAFRQRDLTCTFYYEPMGRGARDSSCSSSQNQYWYSHLPYANAPVEFALKSVCILAK